MSETSSANLIRIILGHLQHLYFTLQSAGATLVLGLSPNLHIQESELKVITTVINK